MTRIDDNLSAMPRASKVTFTEDFKRFFMRGLAALLPTLITLTVIRLASGLFCGNTSGGT